MRESPTELRIVPTPLLLSLYRDIRRSYPDHDGPLPWDEIMSSAVAKAKIDSEKIRSERKRRNKVAKVASKANWKK